VSSVFVKLIHSLLKFIWPRTQHGFSAVQQQDFDADADWNRNRNTDADADDVDLDGNANADEDDDDDMPLTMAMTLAANAARSLSDAAWGISLFAAEADDLSRSWLPQKCPASLPLGAHCTLPIRWSYGHTHDASNGGENKASPAI